MKCYEIELNGENIKLRLTSEAIMEIEKKNNKSILEIMKDVSIDNGVRKIHLTGYSVAQDNIIIGGVK